MNFSAKILGCFFLSTSLLVGDKLHAFQSSSATASDEHQKVLMRITPHWIDAERFWYETQEGENALAVCIDIANAKRTTGEEHLQKVLEATQSEPDKNAKNTFQSSSSTDNQAANITFQNDTNLTIHLYWLDAQGRSHKYHTLAPNAQMAQSTYTGHSWFAVDDQDRPVWTNVVSRSKGTLSIREQSFSEPAPHMRRRNRPTLNQSPDGQWKSHVQNSMLGFKNIEDREVSIDFKDAVGTPEFRYESQLHWSPDSRYAVATQIRQGQHRELVIVESSPKDQLQPKLLKRSYDKPGDELDRTIPRLFDLESKSLIPISDELFSNPWSIEDFRWAPDSSSFTFVYNQRGHQTIRLIGVDAASGKTRTLVEETAKTYVDYAHKAYRHYLTDTQEVIWGSERDGWYHLYLFDTAQGKLKNQITQGPWVVRSVEKVDEQARQIWFYAGGIASNQDPYYRHLCRVNFDGSGLVQLTQGDGDHQCQFSPDGRYLIDTYSRVDMPPVHELRSAVDGHLVLTLEKNESFQWDRARWNRPERFSAKARDGQTDIYGIIVRPKDMKPNTKYPIIESIYAGPQDSFVPKSFSRLEELHELADQGFIVVKIDGMGTSNRSKAFHDVSYRNLSDGGFLDRKLWIQEAAKRYPEFDLERVGIYGGSAGGQNAMAAVLFHGDFYDAAVADCGCHDNRMDKVWWNELYMGWPVGPHYEANSNVVNAHRLNGKLFLIVGELDTNVDPASTMQVVNALIKANKDFEMLVVPGAGHGIGSGPYGKRRRDDFFRRHLGSPTTFNRERT